ncbi:MAG: Hsp20/alpha crystallin family protein [Cytophagaceae bacterium]|nr:Hsp20/alpha crystallin family protein [Cytophagaceae bacterium]
MKTIKIPKEILASVDLFNTLNGGRSQSRVQVARQEEGYEVLVNVPGLQADQLQVDVSDGRLWIYQLHPVLARRSASREDAEASTYLPSSISNFVLPNDVDVTSISARYQNGHWLVFLPFNDKTKGFRKHVEIEQ